VAGAEQLHAINTSQGVGAASATALLAVSCVERGAATAAWGQTKLEGDRPGKGTADEVMHCSKPWALFAVVSGQLLHSNKTTVLVRQDRQSVGRVSSYPTRGKSYSFDRSNHSLQKVFAAAAATAHQQHPLLVLSVLLLLSSIDADMTLSGGGQLPEPVDQAGSSSGGHVQPQALQVSKTQTHHTALPSSSNHQIKP
jgi:hypothetical protein